MVSSFRNIRQLSKNESSNLSKRADEYKIIHIFSCVTYRILTIHLFCFLPSTQVFSVLPPVLCVPNGIQKSPASDKNLTQGFIKLRKGLRWGYRRPLSHFVTALPKGEPRRRKASPFCSSCLPLWGRCPKDGEGCALAAPSFDSILSIPRKDG